jgi:hypothetical protein
MPSFRIHLFGYAVFASALSYYLLSNGQIPMSTNLVIALVLGAFFCILPDIDTPASKARNWSNKALLITIVLSLLVYKFYIISDWLLLIAIGAAVLMFTFMMLKHRQLTHSVWFIGLLAIPIYLYSPLYAIYAVLGFLSHRLLDFF